jgi:hypothetical protein
VIDFSKLKVPTAAEIAEAGQRRRAQEIAGDMTRRHEWSRKAVALTLTRETEFRHTLSGGQCLHLHGSQPNGRTIDAVWYAPDHFTRGQIDEIWNKLAEGINLTLEGYWKPFTATGQTRFTFVAQFIHFPEGQCVP